MTELPHPTTHPYLSLQMLVDEVRGASAAWFVARGLPPHMQHGHVLGEGIDWHENLK